MSLNVIPRAFGTCLVDISNACSDFFAKRMNKVENQKVDDSAHLAHASSTLDKSPTIPADGKWHCVISESKNLTNAEIQRYIREDKGLGVFRVNNIYPRKNGIHTSYFKCDTGSKCNCSFKVERSEDSNGKVHTTVEVRNPNDNKYEEDFNEFEPEDDSSDDKYVPRRAYRYEYKAGYLYASRVLVSRLRVEAASTLRRGGSIRSQGVGLRKLLEQRRDAFVRYWNWASDPDFNPKAFSLSFDDWKSLSSDFYVVTPLQLTPQPEKGSILECFGDIPWCCTCTRKIERGIGGYQNTRCCLHVMHASMTVSGMEDPPDLGNDLVGKQKRGRKRIHGRQARTNRYGVTVRKPAKKRKVNKE